MGNKNQIGSSFAAFMLVLALMLPSGIQFAHIFEGHEHISCNDHSVHLHKSVTQCEISHFHLANFNYELADYPDFSTPKIPARVEEQISSLLFHSFKINNTQLRAPPHFLIS